MLLQVRFPHPAVLAQGLLRLLGQLQIGIIAERIYINVHDHEGAVKVGIYVCILIALCAALLYEAVSIIYIAMSSAELTSAFFTRALTDALMTTLTAVVLMWPLRRLLGFGAPVSKAMAKG